jgi:regulatory protein
VDEESRSRGSGSRARARKPTYAERRERRAAVEDVAEVMDAAARFLETRPRSEAEVRRKLITMGYPATLVDDVLVRLTMLRYLDDEAFARAWVESRDRASPRGEHALRRELQQKGVDRSLVDGILADRRDAAHEEAAEGDDEPVGADEAAAERLLTKKLAALLREPDHRRRHQRAYALLARSGFGPDVCTGVTRRVLDRDPGTMDDEQVADGNRDPT